MLTNRHTDTHTDRHTHRRDQFYYPRPLTREGNEEHKILCDDDMHIYYCQSGKMHSCPAFTTIWSNVRHWDWPPSVPVKLKQSFLNEILKDNIQCWYSRNCLHQTGSQNLTVCRTLYGTWTHFVGSSDNLEDSLDMDKTPSTPEKQIQHRANTTMHVCWHRNTSVSMRDHNNAVKVGTIFTSIKFQTFDFP